MGRGGSMGLFCRGRAGSPYSDERLPPTVRVKWREIKWAIRDAT